ncbi:MAG: anion permease [Jaaginema sp. PMC 1079.18]|nr:anion permease [Jaaginema sp. PMC 1080.18]MEC4849697.1 anion permease [Jaaginema sp. PMC 1079.18]
MILIAIALLAVFVAWNLGANDVANSMGTSVGSKALSLRQALIVAGGLEFLGAVLFGQAVAATLATEITNPELFRDRPQTLLLGMIAVLLAAGIWLQIATRLGLPVASSHAVVGAIAGFSGLAAGIDAIAWGKIGQIAIAWILTPLISGIVAAVFYGVVRRWILQQPQPLLQLQEWIPWLSVILLGVFGAIVLPELVTKAPYLDLPSHTLSLAIGGGGAVGLTLFSWQRLQRAQQPEITPPGQKKHFSLLEGQLARFQVLSACFVAFAHGSNDVGNAIAPLAAVVYILSTNTVPLEPFAIPLWIMLVGGVGIVLGLGIQGKNVITTIGEDIIPLQPSSGFCAELATAATILVASRLGFPVSTSHALVGAVVGIGLLQSRENVRFGTLKSVILAWAVTLPIAAMISAIAFTVLQLVF